jgi:hypothetical protein
VRLFAYTLACIAIPAFPGWAFLVRRVLRTLNLLNARPNGRLVVKYADQESQHQNAGEGGRYVFEHSSLLGLRTRYMKVVLELLLGQSSPKYPIQLGALFKGPRSLQGGVGNGTGFHSPTFVLRYWLRRGRHLGGRG